MSDPSMWPWTCNQCHGKGAVLINGKQVTCTCKIEIAHRRSTADEAFGFFDDAGRWHDRNLPPVDDDTFEPDFEQMVERDDVDPHGEWIDDVHWNTP